MKKIFIAIEILTILIAVIFGILWIRNPQGNYEPIIAMCGTIGLVLEFVRRIGPWKQSVIKEQPSDDIPSLLSWLLTNALSLELSRLLPFMIRLAQKLGRKDLEKWARLELNGYYGEYGMTETDVVPEYRTVAGQHTDEYGRPLVLPDPRLGFINETRLRHGVKELEELTKTEQMVFVRDVSASSLIREHLGVEVTRFVFNPVAVAGTLERIRIELLDRLNEVRDNQYKDMSPNPA